MCCHRDGDWQGKQSPPGGETAGHLVILSLEILLWSSRVRLRQVTARNQIQGLSLRELLEVNKGIKPELEHGEVSRYKKKHEVENSRPHKAGT